MIFHMGILVVGAALAMPTIAQAEPKVSKGVQQNCGPDYKAFCSEYGLESNALRDCMDRNGKKLSNACVRVLVKEGHVSQAEVDRRKNAAGG